MKFKLPIKNKKSEEKQPQTADKSGVPLSRYWLFAFLGCLIVILMSAAGLYWSHQQQMRDLELRRMQAASESLAAQISRSLSAYHGVVKRLAADKALAELSMRSDSPTKTAEIMRLQGLIPGSVGFHLLPVGHDTADKTVKPPIGYATLDLLRAAEKGKPPPLELHGSGKSELYLAGAAVLRNRQNAMVGLLHLGFDVRFLKVVLGTAPQDIGRIEIQQKVDGRFVKLIDNGAEKNAPQPDFSYPLKNSYLRLVHWPAPSDMGLLNGDMLGPGFVLGGILLAAMILAWQFRSMKRAVDSDKASFVRLIDELGAGRSPRRVQLKIRDFSDVMALLSHRLSQMSDGAVIVKDKPGQTASGTQGADSGQAGQEAGTTAAEAPSTPELTGLPEVIFRPYDIRGVVGESLNETVVRDLGRAIGSQAYDRGQQSVMVGWDTRTSSEPLAQALIEGICSTGRDVIDLGLIPVPVLYFSTHFLGSDAGVMVTGSHNGRDVNGLKVVMGGETLAGEDLLALRERVENGDLLEGSGSTEPQDLLPDYVSRICEDVSIARPMKLVLDCGSGSASLVAPKLFRELGCEVIEQNCEVNSSPGRNPDPSKPENLNELREAVKREGAELGLAFDTDGDRLGVVDSEGNIIFADRLLMLLSSDVLARHPGGDVVFDVKCSRALASQILQNGGRPVMWKSGHSLLKAKLKETGALLGGEWSGHIMFRERWYGFDDAMYAGARLLEILAVDPRSSAEVFAELPSFIGTPELLLPLNEGQQYELMDKAQRKSELLKGAKLITIDGIRAELEDAWGLMRASNTSPALSFRFEADDEAALGRVQDMYRVLLKDIAPNLEAPF